MRYEAAARAGELELRPALARLAEIAFEDDREIQEMAIWALGRSAAKKPTASDSVPRWPTTPTNDDLADVIAEAQSVATLSGSDLLPLFDFSDYDDERRKDGSC